MSRHIPSTTIPLVVLISLIILSPLLCDSPQEEPLTLPLLDCRRLDGIGTHFDGYSFPTMVGSTRYVDTFLVVTDDDLIIGDQVSCDSTGWVVLFHWPTTGGIDGTALDDALEGDTLRIVDAYWTPPSDSLDEDDR